MCPQTLSDRHDQTETERALCFFLLDHNRQTQIYRLVWGPSDFWFWSNKLFRYCGECLSPRLIRVQISLKFGRNMSINVIRTNFVWTNVSVTLVTYQKRTKKSPSKFVEGPKNSGIQKSLFSKKFWRKKVCVQEKFVSKNMLEDLTWHKSC